MKIFFFVGTNPLFDIDMLIAKVLSAQVKQR